MHSSCQLDKHLRQSSFRQDDSGHRFERRKKAISLISYYTDPVTHNILAPLYYNMVDRDPPLVVNFRVCLSGRGNNRY